jgi:hypothetical protein
MVIVQTHPEGRRASLGRCTGKSVLKRSLQSISHPFGPSALPAAGLIRMHACRARPRRLCLCRVLCRRSYVVPPVMSCRCSKTATRCPRLAPLVPRRHESRLKRCLCMYSVDHSLLWLFYWLGAQIGVWACSEEGVIFSHRLLLHDLELIRNYTGDFPARKLHYRALVSWSVAVPFDRTSKVSELSRVGTIQTTLGILDNQASFHCV